VAQTIENLNDLYSDAQTCAKLVGLHYVEADEAGISRIRHGKGFAFKYGGKTVSDKKTKARVDELVVPPAWQDVWICTNAKGHILATGLDERGRKQYIYHPKWRTMRDLIKFYRMILFGNALPKIRKEVDKNLRKRGLPLEKVLATMLWVLDNTYIRIGNDSYFKQNESVGLTTLTDQNVVIAGPVITFSFKGKSGKDQQITLENQTIAKVLHELKQVRGARLFRYKDAAGDWHEIDSDDINKYLHELTGAQISAKDFRTWGGTLMAFLHLLQEQDAEKTRKPEKVVAEAIDQAAAVLGNTRAVAKSSYVHPHILDTYGSKDFAKYYDKAAKQRKVAGLDRNESDLMHFLEQLFEEEFDLLRSNC
jgi:DNA topoisomerase I